MKSGASADSAKADKAVPYCSMSPSDLEALAVAAIQEHRRLLAADEEVYEEWVRASEDPTTPAAVRQTLQDEHVSRQEKSEAQQYELARIIDALGFVPSVPDDDGQVLY